MSDEKPVRGLVSLVGAGPGDPSLITIGGAARLAEADVIVYDRLANPALLAHARPNAERIYAGKQPDRHALTQDEINVVLVEQGLAGKRVVRLKGGDPFVFGRGAEEAEALAAAGVPFEIIPGVTSAIAAPAYAGIPLTHRALASSFAVVTAHEDPAKDDTSIDWARLARGVDTIVVLMGVERLPLVVQRLIEHGRAASTPVAVIEWGTLPRQRVAMGTLETIAASVAAAGVGAPAVTVVGEVARLRDGLRWFDTQPDPSHGPSGHPLPQGERDDAEGGSVRGHMGLWGKRVLVTRTRAQASKLSRALAAQGAEAIELPTIEVARSFDARAVAGAIDGLRTSGYGWVIFSSANAVHEFVRHVRESGLDARAFGRAQIAAIGSGTVQALAEHGLTADLVPQRYVAEALLEAFSARVMRGQHVLLPRAEGARPLIVDGLEAMGARVDELTLYRSAVPADPDAEGLRRLRAGEIDIVTFASSSAVRNLLEMLGGDATPLRATTIAAIGPITAQAVRDAGLDVSVTAEEFSIEGLVAALVAKCGGAAGQV